MTQGNRDLPSVEEAAVDVVPYDPTWPRLYEREAPRVRSIFAERCVAIEHFGSTAVPGLLAKPIVDILVASIDAAAPSGEELQALAAQGYVFLGQDGRRPERWLWRKRHPEAFNLSVVPSMSDLWRDNLLVRDYLRSHPSEARQYAEIKRSAIAASPNSLLGYQNHKRAFVTGLRARAVERLGRGQSTP